MRINLQAAESLLQEIEVNKIKHPLPRCYFSDDKEHFHLAGTCIHCDWKKQAAGKEWDSPDFIEWWDYSEYWEQKIKAK